MNLASYHELRKHRDEQTPRLRSLCPTCVQPEFGCYCAHIQVFDPKICFVILMHPIEAKRRIATGRMSHLVLQNSSLIIGLNYSQNSRVNAILNDPGNCCVMLYPGQTSVDLSSKSILERAALFPRDRKLTVFVIDGTWNTVRKMVRLSENLHQVPRVSFVPEKPSNFRVRKQPAPNCYSTIEAIHHTIELLGPSQGFETEKREHDRLLDVFDKMVEKQLSCLKTATLNRRQKSG